MEQKIIDIILTDIQLHVAKPRKPLSADRAITKSVKNQVAGRFYRKDLSVSKEGKFQLPLFLQEEMRKIQEHYAREGKSVRFLMPKEGLKVYLGKDTKEHIEAQKRKRVDKKKI
jgi:hypothetical protein